MLHKVQLNPLNEDIQEEAKHTKLKLEQNNTHLQTNDSSFMSKKPVRNEPCPCGSGKKYKNCCGKSGPKQGILAQ